MNLTSPVTGAAQTGLTTPTYTLVTDTPPSLNGKQWAVTALGGTQTGVMANNSALPFTLSYFRPATLKTMPNSMYSVTGMVGNIPRNTFKFITRKSLAVNGSYGYGMGQMTTQWDIPVGANVQDLVSIKAMISAHLGSLQQSLDQWFTAIDQGTL